MSVLTRATFVLPRWAFPCAAAWCLSVLLLATPSHWVWGADPQRRPNIVVILADDYGYADCGAQGCTDIPTPHIDSIARQGIRCTNGYVSGPYCSPTRAGLMTARYQQRFGHEFNPGPAGQHDNDRKGLSLQETTMPQRLKDAGYATGLVGKWHLGASRALHPLNRGFDEYFGFLGGAHDYFRDQRAGNSVLRGFEQIVEPEYLTEAFAREAVAFIERHKDRPFFLYYAFNAVHTPLQASDKYLSRFGTIADNRRRTYAAMASAMDDAVGAVLDKLRAEQLEEHTLIFFFSDNGGPETVNGSNNGPLRGQKAQTWEGGVRVPWLVQWKGHLPAGVTYDQPVIQLDILPTALAAAGLTTQPEWKLDGVDLLPFLRGERTDAPHAALFWRFGAQMAIRKGDWKLVKAPGAGAEFAERRGTASAEGAQLFNLATDIGEQTNLAAEQPEKARELAEAWRQWNAELVEPAFLPGRNVQANARRRQN